MPRLLALCLFAVLNALIGSDASAQAPVAGRVEFVEGDVKFIDTLQQARRPAKGDVLRAGDTILTGRDGEVHLDMDDGGYLAARPNTRLKIVDYRADGGKNDRSIIDLITGTFRSITGWIPRVSTKGYRVTMTTATLGIRGTDHEPLIIPEGSDLGEPGAYDKVNEGSTILEGPAGSVEIPPDAAGFVPEKQSLRARLLPKIPDFFRQTTNEYLFNGRHKQVQEKLQERLDARRKLLEENKTPDASSKAEPSNPEPSKAAPEPGASAPPADAVGAGIPKAPLPAAAGAAGAAGLAVPAPPVSAPGVPAPPGVPDLSSVSSMRAPMPAAPAVPEAAPIAPVPRTSAAPETAPPPRTISPASTAAPAASAAKPPAAASASPVPAQNSPATRAAEEDRAARLKRERDARLGERHESYEKDRKGALERDAQRLRDVEGTAGKRRF